MMSLEFDLTLCPFSRIMVVGFLPRLSDISEQVYGPDHGVNLRDNILWSNSK